jgi:type IV pilus assembly protein PilF
MKRLVVAAWLVLSAVTALAEGSEQEMASPRERARVHTELAAAYFSTSQLGVALEELNIAIQADSGYAPAFNMLGLVHMELKEDDKAVQAFERSLRLDPNSSNTQNNFGWFLCQRGRVDESIRHFLASLKDPLFASPETAYLNAGLCSRKKGDEQGAEDYFLKALKLRPQLPAALFNLADVNFKRSNLAAAKNYFTRYMQAAANPPAEHLMFGVRIERRMGDKEAEASYGLMLRKRFPDSNEAQLLKSGKYE